MRSLIGVSCPVSGSSTKESQSTAEIDCAFLLPPARSQGRTLYALRKSGTLRLTVDVCRCVPKKSAQKPVPCAALYAPGVEEEGTALRIRLSIPLLLVRCVGTCLLCHVIRDNIFPESAKQIALNYKIISFLQQNFS